MTALELCTPPIPSPHVLVIAGCHHSHAQCQNRRGAYGHPQPQIYSLASRCHGPHAGYGHTALHYIPVAGWAIPVEPGGVHPHASVDPRVSRLSPEASPPKEGLPLHHTQGRRGYLDGRTDQFFLPPA